MALRNTTEPNYLTLLMVRENALHEYIKKLLLISNLNVSGEIFIIIKILKIK